MVDRAEEARQYIKLSHKQVNSRWKDRWAWEREKEKGRENVRVLWERVQKKARRIVKRKKDHFDIQQKYRLTQSMWKAWAWNDCRLSTRAIFVSKTQEFRCESNEICIHILFSAHSFTVEKYPLSAVLCEFFFHARVRICCRFVFFCLFAGNKSVSNDTLHTEW